MVHVLQMLGYREQVTIPITHLLNQSAPAPSPRPTVSRLRAVPQVLSFGVNPLKEFNISVPALLAGLDQNWLPARPDLCPDALWRVAVMCLQQDPKRRPEMSSIVPLMEAVAAGAQTQ